MANYNQTTAELPSRSPFAAAVSVDIGTTVSPVASFDNDWQRQQYRNFVSSGGFCRF